MLILGLILIIIALVVIGYMWFGTAELGAIPIDLGVFTVQLTPLYIFLLGGAALLVLALGAVILSSGLRRQSRKRREIKDLRKQVAHDHPRDRSHGDDRARQDDRAGRDDLARHDDRARQDDRAGRDDLARDEPVPHRDGTGEQDRTVPVQHTERPAQQPAQSTPAPAQDQRERATADGPPEGVDQTRPIQQPPVDPGHPRR